MKVLRAEDNESLSHWLLKLPKEERMAVDRAGADDSIVKPFETRERVARIKALARCQNGEKHTDFACGDLTCHTHGRQFRIRGEPLSLRA